VVSICQLCKYRDVLYSTAPSAKRAKVQVPAALLPRLPGPGAPLFCRRYPHSIERHRHLTVQSSTEPHSVSQPQHPPSIEYRTGQDRTGQSSAGQCSAVPYGRFVRGAATANYLMYSILHLGLASLRPYIATASPYSSSDHSEWLRLSYPTFLFRCSI
jgi:hypothetical protein